MIFGFITINAAFVSRAVMYADSFVLAQGTAIPLPVLEHWRRMRPELIAWRDRLKEREQ